MYLWVVWQEGVCFQSQAFIRLKAHMQLLFYVALDPAMTMLDD